MKWDRLPLAAVISGAALFTVGSGFHFVTPLVWPRLAKSTAPVGLRCPLRRCILGSACHFRAFASARWPESFFAGHCRDGKSATREASVGSTKQRDCPRQGKGLRQSPC